MNKLGWNSREDGIFEIILIFSSLTKLRESELCGISLTPKPLQERLEAVKYFFSYLIKLRQGKICGISSTSIESVLHPSLSWSLKRGWNLWNTYDLLNLYWTCFTSNLQEILSYLWSCLKTSIESVLHPTSKRCWTTSDLVLKSLLNRFYIQGSDEASRDFELPLIFSTSGPPLWFALKHLLEWRSRGEQRGEATGWTFP